MICKLSMSIPLLALVVLCGCAGPKLNLHGANKWGPDPIGSGQKLPPIPATADGWNPGLQPPVEVEPVEKERWQPIYFAYDQSVVGDTERPKLDKICGFLKKNGTYHLLVEGHCDDRGSEEYNRALGERRALAVKNYLIDSGLSSNRLHTLSFGEEKPVKEGISEETFRLNRRAELIVLPPKSAASLKK